MAPPPASQSCFAGVAVCAEQSRGKRRDSRDKDQEVHESVQVQEETQDNGQDNGQDKVQEKGQENVQEKGQEKVQEKGGKVQDKVQECHKLEQWIGTKPPSLGRRLLTRSFFQVATLAARVGLRERHQLPPQALIDETGLEYTLHQAWSRRAVGVRAVSLACRDMQQADVKAMRVPIMALLSPPRAPWEESRAPLANEPGVLFTVRKEPGKHPDDAQMDSVPTPGPGVAVLYVHGGGFVSGDFAGFKGLCCRLSAGLGGCPVFFVQYRLAPEWAIRDAVADVAEAYRSVVQQLRAELGPDGPEPEVVLMADSAGGNLLLLFLQQLLCADGGSLNGLPAPKAACLFSPVSDFSCSGASYEANAGVDPVCVLEVVKVMLELAAGGVDLQDPALSPRFGPFTGALCPLFLSAARDELFADDAVAVARRAAEAGVEVELQLWDGVCHGWPLLWEHHPEGLATLEAACAFAFRRCRRA